MPRLRRALGSKLLWGATLASAIVAACGGNPQALLGGANGGGEAGHGATGVLGEGGTEPELQLGGMTGLGEAGEPAVQLELVVTAEAEELEVTGEPATLQLEARYEDGSRPNRVL